MRTYTILILSVLALSSTIPGKGYAKCGTCKCYTRSPKRTCAESSSHDHIKSDDACEKWCQEQKGCQKDKSPRSRIRGICSEKIKKMAKMDKQYKKKSEKFAKEEAELDEKFKKHSLSKKRYERKKKRLERNRKRFEKADESLRS